MNLQPITAARIEGQFPHLFSGWTIGNCINPRPTYRFTEVVGHKECGKRVLASDGFADLDGTPFKAYYCPSCVAEIKAKS